MQLVASISRIQGFRAPSGPTPERSGILQVRVEVGILGGRRLLIDQLERAPQLPPDVSEQHLRSPVELVTLVLAPWAGIRWVALVQRLVVPSGHLAAPLQQPWRQRKRAWIGEVVGSQAKLAAGGFAAGPQASSAPLEEEPKRIVNRAHREPSLPPRPSHAPQQSIEVRRARGGAGHRESGARLAPVLVPCPEEDGLMPWFRRRMLDGRELVRKPLAWKWVGDSKVRWECRWRGHLLQVHPGDWPDEAMYILYVNGKTAGALAGWPKAWKKLD